MRPTSHHVCGNSTAIPQLGSSSPVVAVQLHHSLFQLTGLVGREVEVADVVGAVFFRLVVSELGLDSVGAQKGVGDERAGETPGKDVIPQL